MITLNCGGTADAAVTNLPDRLESVQRGRARRPPRALDLLTVYAETRDC